MRILHTADIHLGDLTGPMKDGRNARRFDTLECMRSIVATAAETHPSITIVAGDLFNRSRVWADTALEDVNDAITEFIRPLCQHSEHVVVLFGTENHDNPRSFEVLEQTTRNEANLHIYTQPDVYNLETMEGPVQILALPGFDKGRLRLFCPGADKETENRNATALINDVLMGLSTKIDRSIPSILVGHYTVAGSEADNGSTFLAGQDVVLLPTVIDSIGVDLACLGHIHRAQRLNCNTPAYYSGSPNQLNFNDEGTEHGFYIHEIVDDRSSSSRFITAPERKHFTLRLSPDDIAGFLTTGILENLPLQITGAVVRIRYSCPAEQEKALNKADLQKKVLAAGAFHVTEVLPGDIEDATGAGDINEHEGPTEALERYLGKLNLDPEDMKRLQELAAPLIKKADDGRDADKCTGNFAPLRIEVTNYRSYTQAEFSFDDIRMAMVNGQNGVGKSSLFMDAIADCIFEETRKEEIGGWVRDGCKSGSISFEFSMGAETYRIIRTRTKTGRGTLALQRQNKETSEWMDESDTTMRLTQERIEHILGMDCNTFCSIALIRQDAYGLFLEASSDRRMEVLSALLGLDIYGRLEGLAKDGATEQRRLIAAARERLDILQEQIAVKPDLQEEDARLATEEHKQATTIETLDIAIEAAQREEAMRLEVMKQATEKDTEAANFAAEAAAKETTLATIRQRLQEALKLADALPTAEKAAAEVAEARLTLAALAPKEEELRAALQQRENYMLSLNTRRANVTRLQGERNTLTGMLERAEEITQAQRQLEDIQANKAEIEARLSKYLQAAAKRDKAKSEKDAFLAESRIRIGELTEREREASQKVALLVDSNCPIPDKASCAFLTDAIKARDLLEDIREKLQATRNEDRAEYELLDGIYSVAKTEADVFGDPAAELERISVKERAILPIANLAASLAEAEAKRAAIDEQIIVAEADIEETEQRLTDIADHLPELEAYHADASRAREAVAAKESASNLLPQCKAAAATSAALEPQIAALEADIESLNTKSGLATFAAVDLRRRIPEATSDLPSLLNERSRLMLEHKTIAGARGGIKTRLEGIAEAEKQTEKYRTDITAIGRMLNDYQTLAQAFGLDGIQYMIIRGIVPEIMHRANDILAAMTGGRMAVDIRTEKEQKSSQKIVNSLEVWITSITGGSRPYLSHSGGEKVKIALAVTLGLADIKARRAGVQLGMLFIDEPPFLDADGTEAYADALSSMAARNPSMRILAISHDPTMKARFPQNITVTATDNGSVVSKD